MTTGGRPGAGDVGRGVAVGLEMVVRDWLLRLTALLAVLLAAFAALTTDAAPGLRGAGVGVGVAVLAAVVVAWWRKLPAAAQWVVAVVGTAASLGLLVVLLRG